MKRRKPAVQAKFYLSAETYERLRRKPLSGVSSNLRSVEEVLQSALA